MADLDLTQDLAHALVTRAMDHDAMRTSILRSMSSQSKQFGYVVYDDGRIKATVLNDAALALLTGGETDEEVAAGKAVVLDAIVEARGEGHFPFVVQSGPRIIVVAAFVRTLTPPNGLAFTSPGGDA